MTVGELIVRFGAELGPLRKGIEDAQRAIKPMQDRMRALGRGLSTYITAPAVGAAGALTALTSRAADYADEIDKTSIRTGLATDTLQELRFAADQTGVEFGSIQRAVEGLTRRLTQVDEGSGRAAEAMERLGIRTRGADGEMRRMDDLFPDVISALQQMTNETERNALAIEVFGRSAGQLTPLLASGEQGLDQLRERARELGLVMSGDSIRAMVAFKDQWAEVREQLSMAGMELGVRFMPILRDDLIPFLQDTVVPALGRFVEFIGDTIDAFRALNPTIQRSIMVIGGIAVALGPVMLAASSLMSMLPYLGAAFAAATSPVTLMVAAVGALAAGAAYLIDNWDAAKDEWGRTWDTMRLMTFAAIDAMLEKVQGIVAIFRPQYRRLIEATRGALQEAMAGIDLSRPRAEFKTLADYIRAAKREARDLIAGMPVEGVEIGGPPVVGGGGAQSVSRLGEVAKASAQGVEVLAGGLEVARVRSDELRDSADDAARSLTMVEEFGLRTSEMFAGALSYGIGRIVEGVLLMEDGFRSLTDVISEFGRMAQRVFARLIADITAAVTKAAALKGIGAIFGVATGGFGGLVMGALGFGGARAMGGPVSAGQTYLVGERGPELFTPPTSGQIIPNHALGGQARTEVQVLQPVIGISRGELIAWIDQGRRVQGY